MFKVVLITIVLFCAAAVMSVFLSVNAVALPDKSLIPGSDTGSVRGVSVKSFPHSRADDFRITIQKIALNEQVVANVDPRSREEYLPIISRNVAHGMFTKLPDQAVNDGNVYLFAHSDGENPIFRNLDELESGDLIEIDYLNIQYLYKVDEKFAVAENEVSVYTGESERPTLTLQTCSGEKERLIIKATLVNVQK